MALRVPAPSRATAALLCQCRRPARGWRTVVPIHRQSRNLIAKRVEVATRAWIDPDEKIKKPSKFQAKQAAATQQWKERAEKIDRGEARHTLDILEERGLIQETAGYA